MEESGRELMERQNSTTGGTKIAEDGDRPFFERGRKLVQG